MRDTVVFLDLEVSSVSHKIQNIGILLDDFASEQISIKQLKEVFALNKPKFICGHNFVDFDKKHLSNSSFNALMQSIPIIDTLYLSLLLFPDKATHKLEKPYKKDIHRENPQNSPLQDCKNTKILFTYLDRCFSDLSQNMQYIFALLLQNNKYFKGYFLFKQMQNLNSTKNIVNLIEEEFGFKKEDFNAFLKTPLEFALTISFINKIKIKKARYFSFYVLTNYPYCVSILKSLRNDDNLNLESFAKDEFNIENFREFQRPQSQSLFDDSSKISQKDIIISALRRESFLAILPTGGGKTFTFQLPALIRAGQYKSLSVVISPLQALMQNHIETFRLKNQNFCIEAISGFLDPIERYVVFNRLINGEVDILYLAPESLRSTNIFKALQKRYIERFIIDEAHCFSMWGHNFRQDYHFIAQTIKDLELSPHQDKISVSCFTATAKLEVIEDIKQYFYKNLNINLRDFIASSERKSLSYKVVQVEDETEKKEKLWQILLQIEQEKPKDMKNPTIIYIPQNAGLCKILWTWLQEKIDNFGLNLIVEPFYARLDDDVSDGKKDGHNKAEILQAFMDKNNEVDIIIATTAFGMGIDKPNITTIIHYELSDSLESYIQESGRGARDEGAYQAKCFILYSKKDIDKNFAQLRRSNLDFGEIRELVKVLKNEQRRQKTNPVYISLKSLHKKLGKDEDEFDPALIKTALLELEKAGFIERKRTKTHIYATSLNIKKCEDNMDVVHQILDPQKEIILSKSKEKRNFDEKVFLNLYEVMILIIQNIIQRSRENSIISLDDLGDVIGSIDETQMVQTLKILENYEILAKDNDIFLFVEPMKAKEKMNAFFAFEREFFDDIKIHIQRGQSVDLRKFNNERLKNLDILDTRQNPIYVLKFIIKSWSYVLNLAQIPFKCYFKNEQCSFTAFSEIDKLNKAINSRKKIALFIVDKVIEKIIEIYRHKGITENASQKLKAVEIDISSSKIYDSLQKNGLKSSLNGFHYVFNMISEIIYPHFDIRGGRLIYHQKECIAFSPNKLNEKYPYLREHYDNSFKIFMQQKIANIHILKIFLDNFVKSGEEFALSFVKDYFTLNKKHFLKKYGIKEDDIKSPISKELLNKIIGNLNESQRKILDDENRAIMIFAGPGSGKTKTLVHKMAHLLTKEDKKSDNFLMLTHSRIAMLEFRDRLYRLLGEQSLGVKILTFHSFALSLLGERVQNDKELDNKIEQATEALRKDEINLPYIEMLMLDEYQDVNAQSYDFIKAIYEKMSGEKQIIAVGDDDQLIMAFNRDEKLNANKKFIQYFKQDFGVQYDGQVSFSEHTLSINYRSLQKIINIINAYKQQFLPDGLKVQNLEVDCKNREMGFTSFTQHKFNLSLKEMAREIQRISIDEKQKSIAVLLRSNDEILEMRYELENLGVKASYILNKEGFKVGNLIETWEFLEYLKEGLGMNEAYIKICKKYKNSQNLIIFKKMFEYFKKEYSNDLVYIKNADDELGHNIIIADFEKFLQELSFDELEEFENKVIVSTMHKAKGKEFDIVFVGINDKFQFNLSVEKRLLYVAITRAKQKLFIHNSQKDILNPLKSFFDENKTYHKKDEISQQISYIMGLSDIQLDYKCAQNNIKKLKTYIVAGDECVVKIQNNQGLDYIDILWENKCVASLSKNFREILFQKMKQGYKLLDKAKVKYVVKWRNDDNKMNTEILCEICLRK